MRFDRPNKLSKDYLRQIERSLVDSTKVRGARVVRSGGKLSINVPRRRGSGRSSLGYRFAILVNATPNETIFDNHLVCRLYDPLTGTVGDTDIKVAKPFHLWRDLFDGETIEYADGSSVTYAYDDADFGMVRTADDGVIDEWEEWIQPFYYDGSIIRILPVPTLAVEPLATYEGQATFGGATPTRVTRPSGSWITDGFYVGATIVVSGTASNDGSYVVETVGATAMTVEGAGFVSETGVTCTIRAGQVAQWMDANVAGRHFRKRRIDLKPNTPLEFDANDRLSFDLAEAGTHVLTVVTGGSISIVAGTPNKLRLTLTRATATFRRQADLILFNLTTASASSITSDLNLDECA